MITIRLRQVLWIICAAFILVASGLQAHSIPDIPVRAYFSDGGKLEIRVEVDPRAWLEDPEAEGHLLKGQVPNLDEQEIREMELQATRFLSQRLRFIFAPDGELKPNWKWEFRKLGDLEWKEPSDETALVGSWTLQMGESAESYQLEALEMDDTKMGRPLNVMFLNYVNGVQEDRYVVLFPGEASFAFDLKKDFARPKPGSVVQTVGAEPKDNSEKVATESTEEQPVAGGGGKGALFLSEVKRGFLHVVPLGLDHIVFVLGVFLLSRKWKPLILQVSAFTVAHTLTLWLASAGYVDLPGSVVEPIIAASIVVVALENIFHAKYTHWRLLIVFVFGLIHGLGFAGVMATRLDSTAALVIGLLGINVGVELGHLLVLAAALLATAWIAGDKEKYRKWVVIPGSVLIALVGLWWVIERTLL